MVPQEDTLLPFLTVLETVMYSAELRLPWFIPRWSPRPGAPLKTQLTPELKAPSW
jgi:hypothetical protein